MSLRALVTVACALAVMLFAGGPAAADPAAENCGQPSWSVGVQYLSLQSAQNIVLAQQPDGSFAATVIVRVYCYDSATGTDLGEVTNAKVKVWTSVTGTTVDGMNAYDTAALGAAPATFAEIDLPTGRKQITIRSTDPGLDVANGTWNAQVGSNKMNVTVAFGQSVGSGQSPAQIGQVWARTPELGSLALFGSGAAGMAGYALVRLRAMRRRSA